MEDNITTKLKGFRASQRNKWAIRTHFQLKDKAFLLYDLLIDITDFDRGHKNFSSFEFFPEEIAPYLQIKQRSVKEHFKTLVDAKLVQPFDTKRFRYSITNYERYLIVGGHAAASARQEKLLSVQEIATNMTNDADPVQTVAEKDTSKTEGTPLSFSKGLSLSKDSSKISIGLSKEEKEVIFEEEFERDALAALDSMLGR